VARVRVKVQTRLIRKNTWHEATSVRTQDILSVSQVPRDTVWRDAAPGLIGILVRTVGGRRGKTLRGL
jgi:hypothetical protein